MRVVFATARSSPGVTTAVLACASVWPGRVLLVEAAEDGGALAARFGLPVEPGLTTLVAASRHATNGQAPGVVLGEHVQRLPGTDRLGALVAPASLEVAQALWRTAASRLVGLLGQADADVLVDAGRLSAAPLVRPVIESSDRLVLTVRPRVEELTALAHRLASLSQLGPVPELLLVGQRPYGPDEVADTLGVPVLGVLAEDAHAADGLAAAGPVRRLARSSLLRSAGAVVDRLTDRPPQPSQDTGERGLSTAPAGRVQTGRRWLAVGRS